MTIFHETEEGTFVDCAYCQQRDHIANHFWSEVKDAPICADCHSEHEHEQEEDNEQGR